MPPRAVPAQLPPAISHLLPRSAVLVPAGLPDKSEPTIRRYAIHWLQHAAARVHKRCERTQRQSLFVASVLGVHQLFDVSDVPVRSRSRTLPGLAGAGSSQTLGEHDTGGFRRV